MAAKRYLSEKEQRIYEYLLHLSKRMVRYRKRAKENGGRIAFKDHRSEVQLKE